MALLLPFNGITPQVASDAFLAPTAVLIGDVHVESQASVWFGTVLRGDNPEHGIRVGRGAALFGSDQADCEQCQEGDGRRRTQVDPHGGSS